MIDLSVNVNKVATLRNSRGGAVPSVLDAVDACLRAGAQGITVHPRADERHITAADVTDIAARLARAPGIQFNIEGDPRPDLIDRVLAVRPTQCTLVPVTPGEITSHAGWSADTSPERLTAIIKRLQFEGIRVSLFIEPDPRQIEAAMRLKAPVVEFHTGRYAHVEGEERAAELRRIADAAALAWLANLACLELHPHPVRVDDLDHPDELRVDLDPVPGVKRSQLRKVAHVVRDALRDFGLTGWPKTSGSRGIHVNVRIRPEWTFTEVRRCASPSLARWSAARRRSPRPGGGRRSATGSSSTTTRTRATGPWPPPTPSVRCRTPASRRP